MDKFKSSLKIYPNPMVDHATVSFDPSSLNAFEKISFILYDINGRKVKSIDRIISSETAINRDELENGIYIFQFIGDNNRLASGKIIVQ